VKKPTRLNQHLKKTGRLHIDRRAAALAAPAADDDELIDTPALASWLAVSTAWVEIGRCKGYGPQWQQLGPGTIRYRKGDVRIWLAERAYKHTQNYARPATQVGPRHVSRRKAVAT
jgi:hypothetical protein